MVGAVRVWHVCAFLHLHVRVRVRVLRVLFASVLLMYLFFVIQSASEQAYLGSTNNGCSEYGSYT